MFLVFAGQYFTECGTSSGGWSDYINDFYQEDVAIAFAEKIKSQYDWIQVVDSEVKKVVWEY